MKSLKALLLIVSFVALVGCNAEPTKPEDLRMSIDKKTMLAIYTSGYYQGLLNIDRSDSILVADSLKYAKFIDEVLAIK